MGPRHTVGASKGTQPRRGSLSRRVISRGLSCALLALWGELAPATAGAKAIYQFVDERGVVHLSDVPHDVRYQRYRWPPTPTTALPWTALGPPRWVTRYDELITYAALIHGVSPALVKAVVHAESNFRPDAVSRVGALGLMQLMPATARSLGVRDPLLPRENVLAGTRYLRAMIDRYGDLRRALAAYNAGPRAVDRYGQIPPYPETRAYVARVLHYYRHYDGARRVRQ